MNSRQRYKAFISYSHRDRKVAEWLHRALETYRAPRALASAGASLRPIFRDRDELSASADLNHVIRDALDLSDALIVLCSPASVASRWVDQEVEYFLKGSGLARILCVITPDTPAATPLSEVLPPSLHAALPEGVEPLAVDLRPDADGKRLARLKIAARLLGVSLDRLVQRDARRRLQVMTAFTSVAVAIALGMGVMTVVTLKSRQIAREQRDETEALVAYMLGDLRQQLEPVGRLDLLDGVSAKVLAYYGKARTDRLDDKALAQRAKAQTLLGTIREQRGDLAGAQDAFGQAAATTHALAARDPSNGDRIFDEAQNVFWLAYMQWKRGDFVRAEQGLKRYDELAQRLVKLDATRADWRVEVGYARSNLGTLQFEQGRPEEALAAFRGALEVFDAELARAPNDKTRIADATNSQAWAADSLLRLGRPLEAFAERERAADRLARAAAADPADKRLAAKDVAMQLALARLEMDLGRLAQARARSDANLRRLRVLAALDPTNARWREYMVVGQLDAVDIACWSGRLAEARAAHDKASASLTKLNAGDKGKVWQADLDGRLAKQAVILAQQGGDQAGARASATTLLDALKAGRAKETAELEGFARLALGQASEAAALLAPKQETLPLSSRDVLARAYLATGRRNLAENIVRLLKKQGYEHPAFLAFWQDSPVGGISSREKVK
jgi:tetratricopeptide (TPR) repeat protein